MIDSAPLHLRCKEFHNLKVIEISGTIENSKKQLVQSLVQIVKDCNPEELDSLINEICQNYGKLRTIEENNYKLQKNMENGKQRYRSVSESLPPLTIDTWEQYSREPGPSLMEFVKSNPQDDDDATTEVPVTKEDRILRALPHIWQDPQCVLPDDTQGDDLQIRGGKIELVCPITYRPFENPMISMKCGHVFDSSGLNNYFESQPSRDCPQGACMQKLTLRDFRTDEIMKLRCHLYMKKVRQQENNLDVL